MTVVNCQISAENFVISEQEKQLRDKFGFGDSLPIVKPKYRFRELGAFWPHWNLHQRTCSLTKQNIISTFRPDCIYPVWQKDRWIAENNPPSADFDFSRSFFEQAWGLFQKCPLPHIFQKDNENCEYTDDFYHSRNCYLCHSGEYSQDCHYCIYSTKLRDCHYCVFGIDSELCFDLVSSQNCYNLAYGIHCRNVQDSAFLYDCRNCRDCMFCFNLRNKRFCFGNKQLTEVEFIEKKKSWNLFSNTNYSKAKSFFAEMMIKTAFHKAVFIDNSENTTGDYLEHCKNCENCFELSYHENCVNDLVSGPDAKFTLDALGTIGTELTYYTVMTAFCYQTTFSFQLNSCRFSDYSAYCFQCENCFGCCGLYQKKFHIFNKAYKENEYKILKERICNHMKETKEWGTFFPGYFAPNPYNESLSGFRFKLSNEEQEKLGLRTAVKLERKQTNYSSSKEVADQLTPDLMKAALNDAQHPLINTIFWDEEYQRPFKISKADIVFSNKIGVPLPSSYYVNRLQDNYKWIPFSGELRLAKCFQCKKETPTNWPEKYDGKILCESCYNSRIN